MRSLITASIAQFGTAVGCLIGIAAWSGHTGWRVALAIVVVLGAAYALINEIQIYRKEMGRPYRTPARINRFMFDWIGDRGHVVVVSNDMSWVSENVYTTPIKRMWHWIRQTKSHTIRELLEEKAQKGELTVCLPKRIDLSDKLKLEGARVATYEALDFVPKTRFTIVRHGQQDSEVAIGRKVRGVHRIEVFEIGHHPAAALAEDLANIILQYSNSHP